MKMIKQRTSREPSLHPADAVQIEDMAGRGELDTRLHWLHHLFFDDEASAREASRLMVAAGWNQDWLAPQPAPYPGWVVRAGRDVVISHEEVSVAREFFEGLSDHFGGSYGGWDVRRVSWLAMN